MQSAKIETVRAGEMQPDDTSGFRRLGLFFLVVFLFLAFGRITDILLPNLHLAFIFAVLALIVTTLTGGLARVLRSPLGLWLSALTVWLILCVPFSFWRGGSFQLLRDQWVKSLFAFVVVGGLPLSLKECRWVMSSIAAGSMAVVLMCLAWGTTSTEGRLVAQLQGGALANPNDLAQLLLMGLPFLFLTAISTTSGIVKRIVAALCIVGVLLVTTQTGSRMALVALTVLVCVMVMTSSWATRVKLVCSLVLAALLVLPSISTDQRRRYLTMFEDSSSGDLTAGELSAIESRDQRLEEFNRSLRFTLQNPLFGIGPGQYSSAAAKQSERQGERASWAETHNTFTQISSEAGIPAFVFYVAALTICFRISRSTYKTWRDRPGFTDLANASYCLWLSLIVFGVTAFFSNMAYQMFFPTLAGLCVALQDCARREMLQVTRIAPTPVPVGAGNWSMHPSGFRPV